MFIGEFVCSVEGDEELAGVIVPPPVGHPHHATPVKLETRVELILHGQVM